MKDTKKHLYEHLKFLSDPENQNELTETVSAPLFSEQVMDNLRGPPSSSNAPMKTISQYALLAGRSDWLRENHSACQPSSKSKGKSSRPHIASYTRDPRIFHNVAAPWSAFICGSQGTGKSHTLSCLLENCLQPSILGCLPRPLAGLIFHYDTFMSDSGGTPCEAAFLASGKHVNVRVLCSPTNTRTIEATYARIPGLRIEPLRLAEADLNTQRMMDLMATGGKDSLPLYMHVIQRILRDMRTVQQQTDGTFSYAEFKSKLGAEKTMTAAQKAPLTQRLETLESFMVKGHPLPQNKMQASKKKKKNKQVKTAQTGIDWKPKPGQLTIVDLSCPCVTPDMACSLFSIALSLFLEQPGIPASTTASGSGTTARPPAIGRVVALDEAHKYLTASQSPEAATLTETLLRVVRLQRHYGVRVIVSTQEPTVSPRLLDLCNITFVHRFTSPSWMRALKDHLAGARASGQELGISNAVAAAACSVDGAREADIFSEVMKLQVGEALLFAPDAVLETAESEGTGSGGPGPADSLRVKKLGDKVLRVRIRQRLTADGGGSVMAS